MTENRTDLMTETDPYREGEWSEVEKPRPPRLSDLAAALVPAHVREANARAAEIVASLPQPAWTVHVAFVDAQGTADEDRIGDGYPRIEGGALIVEVFGDPANTDRVTFQAGWPLRHVHTWFVDYTENES